MTYELQKIDPTNNSKLRSDVRVFVLSLIDAKAPLTNLGLVDKRLFSGENKLRAIKDPQFGLWTLKYDSGILPEALKQQFTSFKVLLKFVTEYFTKRNIKVEEVID